MGAVCGGLNPEEGDRAEREVPPSVTRQLKSRDPISEIEVLGVAMIPWDLHGDEVFREAVSPEDI